MDILYWLILPFAAIDALFKCLYHYIQNAAHWLTGWSNVTLANLTLLGSVIALALKISINNLEYAVPLSSLFTITALLIGQANSYRSFSHYDHITESDNRSKLWWDIAIFRHTLVILCVLDLLIRGFHPSVSLWLLILAPHYFITEPNTSSAGALSIIWHRVVNIFLRLKSKRQPLAPRSSN